MCSTCESPLKSQKLLVHHQQFYGAGRREKGHGKPTFLQRWNDV